MKRKRIIKSGHFYLVPQLDKEPVTLDDGTVYNCFSVLDMKKNLIATYDYIHIEGSVRIDLEEGTFRVYPTFGSLNLFYNHDTHTITSEDLDDGKEKE